MVDVQVRIKWSEPNNWSSGEWNKTIVVLHETVTRETEDGAEKVAGWFNDPNFDASTQFVIDNRDVIQCVPETAYAWSAGTTANQRGIHIELVSMADQSPAEWADDYSMAQLKLAAGLVRELCAKYGIPVTRLDAGDLRAGRSGITGHYDVSHAWHESTHVDIHPDEFPWGRFMQLVAEQEDDMPLTDAEKREIATLTAKETYRKLIHTVGDEETAFTIGAFKEGRVLYPHKALEYGWAYPKVNRELLLKVRAEQSAAEQRDTAILESLNGSDAATILERIEQLHAERETELDGLMAAVDSQNAVLEDLAELARQHADGTLDAEAVALRLREMLHEATAPDLDV